jgi:hypothetical protein
VASRKKQKEFSPPTPSSSIPPVFPHLYSLLFLTLFLSMTLSLLLTSYSLPVWYPLPGRWVPAGWRLTAST